MGSRDGQNRPGCHGESGRSLLTPWFLSLELGSPAPAARSWLATLFAQNRTLGCAGLLGDMANIDRELREEREAKDLEYRWRQGSIEMLLLGRDSPANAVTFS